MNQVIVLIIATGGMSIDLDNHKQFSNRGSTSGLASQQIFFIDTFPLCLVPRTVSSNTLSSLGAIDSHGTALGADKQLKVMLPVRSWVV